LKLVAATVAEARPQELDEGARKENLPLPRAVLVEHLEKVDPDVAHVLAHEAARLRDQLLLARYAVRTYHHEDGEGRSYIALELYWDFQGVTQQISLLFELLQVDLLVGFGRQRIFLKEATEVANQGLPHCVLLEVHVIELSVLLARPTHCVLHARMSYVSFRGAGAAWERDATLLYERHY